MEVPLSVKVLLSMIVGFGIATMAGAASAQERSAEHYQCYAAADPKPFKPREVRLEDQFGKSSTVAVKPALLCTPVSKNGEAIPDKQTHLVCYEIKPTRFKARKVEVRNQFGTESIVVNTPRLLCVPSDKKVLQ